MVWRFLIHSGSTLIHVDLRASPSPRDRFGCARHKDDSSLPQLPGWLRPDVAMCSTVLCHIWGQRMCCSIYSTILYLRSDVRWSETCPRHTVTHTLHVFGHAFPFLWPCHWCETAAQWISQSDWSCHSWQIIAMAMMDMIWICKAERIWKDSVP